MSNGVMVFAAPGEGGLRKPALEALSEGRRLADRLHGVLSAVLIGSAHPGEGNGISRCSRCR